MASVLYLQGGCKQLEGGDDNKVFISKSKFQEGEGRHLKKKRLGEVVRADLKPSGTSSNSNGFSQAVFL